MKVRILIPYYSNEDGKTVRHKPGDVIGISDNIVDKFVKAGFAEYLEKPEKKVVQKCQS